MDPLEDLSDDGRFARPVGPWVLDKLRILACYDQAFGTAWEAAGRWYYLDGFAGSGVHAIRGGDRRVSGAPLIALRTEPQFRRCVLLEGNRVAADALRARTAEFGDRAVVEHGTANADLVPLMYAHVSRSHPCLCVLDTEGADLDWSTVAAIADFKRGQRNKVEQVIVLPTDAGLLRDLPVADGPADWLERDPTMAFGNRRWRAVYDRRRSGGLSPDEARVLYVRLLARGLRELGYRTVHARPILRRGRPGSANYFLILATDDEDGARSMGRCFEDASLSAPPPAVRPA